MKNAKSIKKYKLQNKVIQLKRDVLQKISSAKEFVNEKVEELEVQVQSTEKALKILQEKIINISIVGGEEDKHVTPQELQELNKCIASYYWTFLSYDEYRYKDDINILKYCPNFQKPDNCKKIKCSGYQNYEEYVQAEKIFETEKEKLVTHPWWVMIVLRLKQKRK